MSLNSTSPLACTPRARLAVIGAAASAGAALAALVTAGIADELRWEDFKRDQRCTLAAAQPQHQPHPTLPRQRWECAGGVVIERTAQP